MALAILIAITLACIAWSLWIRRVTWSCRWEVAATLNIALAGRRGAADVTARLRDARALAACADRQVESRGLHRPRPLHRRCIGRRLQRAGQARRTTTPCRGPFKQYVERPATLCIPLLLVTFSLGNGAAIYRPDFFDVPTDLWLNIYWLLLCGTLIYLLGYGARALLILRKDPRSRRVANIYLFASASGIMAVPRPHRHRLRPPAADHRGQHAGVGLRLHCAAPASRSPRRTPGGSRRSGLPTPTTERASLRRLIRACSPANGAPNPAPAR